MDFFKVVLIPPMVASLFGLPMIFILGKAGFFDGLPAIWAGLTGIVIGVVGLILGFIVSIRVNS